MVKELQKKHDLVQAMDDVVAIYFPDVRWVEHFAYQKIGTSHIEEFIVLEWTSGGQSMANNNANSLSATARNVTRMLDGGVYENMDYYKGIMDSEDWVRIV